MPPFEEIDNTADWAFRVSALSSEALFTEAAEALYRMSGVQIEPASEKIRKILLSADDRESLFIQWLNELVFLLDRERLALHGIQIDQLTDTGLIASGHPAEVRSVGKYVKAATYSGIKITQTDGVWQATVVLDV
ncbi:MAG: archease [Anaerolineales bacterium]|jgi:SHS2 domain-containing protein